MSYTEITSLEEAFKRQKDQIDLQRVKDALSFLPERFSDGMLATLEIQVSGEAINNDEPGVPEYEPDYNDESQEKWVNWYIGGDSSGAGFRFFGSVIVWSYSNATGGARFASRDKKRAAHRDKYFQPSYKRFFLVLKPQ